MKLVLYRRTKGATQWARYTGGRRGHRPRGHLRQRQESRMASLSYALLANSASIVWPWRTRSAARRKSRGRWCGWCVGSRPSG